MTRRMMRDMAQVIVMAEIKADFARRLKSRRGELGLTQEGAVYLLNEGQPTRVTLRSYQRWENTELQMLPEGAHAVLIERRMGVPLVGENHPIPQPDPGTEAKGPYPAALSYAMA